VRREREKIIKETHLSDHNRTFYSFAFILHICLVLLACHKSTHPSNFERWLLNSIDCSVDRRSGLINAGFGWCFYGRGERMAEALGMLGLMGLGMDVVFEGRLQGWV
jgi:hypothetical protein